jgi:hypothetical protein
MRAHAAKLQAALKAKDNEVGAQNDSVPLINLLLPPYGSIRFTKYTWSPRSTPELAGWAVC